MHQSKVRHLNGKCEIAKNMLDMLGTKFLCTCIYFPDMSICTSVWGFGK